jgi:hypothetical protein
MQEVVVKYMQRVLQKSNVPRFSYGRGLLRGDGGPNILFFTYLFGDDALVISFLQDAKLIRNQILCDTCGRYVVQRWPHMLWWISLAMFHEEWIDESKFSRRKCHRGHPVKDHWVFGGVDSESGKTILVPVQDRTAKTFWPLYVNGSNPAQGTWVIAGVCTTISDSWVTSNALSTTKSTSGILSPAHTQIQ